MTDRELPPQFPCLRKLFVIDIGSGNNGAYLTLSPADALLPLGAVFPVAMFDDSETLVRVAGCVFFGRL